MKAVRYYLARLALRRAHRDYAAKPSLKTLAALARAENVHYFAKWSA